MDVDDDDEFKVFKFVFRLVGKLIVVICFGAVVAVVVVMVVVIVFICSLSSSLLDEFDKASSLPRLLLALVVIGFDAEAFRRVILRALFKVTGVFFTVD